MTDREVALFDLDGTLTWRDTFVPFLCGYLLRHPERILKSADILSSVTGYLALHHDRGRLKSELIATTMGGQSRVTIEAWVGVYLARLRSKGFRPSALAAMETHRAAGDRLILLSASPDLYVSQLGRMLGFGHTICTEVKWRGDKLDGSLRTPNRRGAEKVRCLAWIRSRYPGLPVVAYGNSDSDVAHMRKADRAILVNGNAAARRCATAAGIPLATWN